MTSSPTDDCDHHWDQFFKIDLSRSSEQGAICHPHNIMMQCDFLGTLFREHQRARNGGSDCSSSVNRITKKAQARIHNSLSASGNSHHSANSFSNLNNSANHFLSPLRQEEIIKWWQVDVGRRPIIRTGATPLVLRCMAAYNWDEFYAMRVLNGYRQFLQIKVDLKDWDALMLAPPDEIDIMWHQHLVDNRKYEEDCRLLCGRILYHDANCGLEENKGPLSKRIRRTIKEVTSRFAFDDIDRQVWSFTVEPVPDDPSICEANSNSTVQTSNTLLSKFSPEPETPKVPCHPNCDHSHAGGGGGCGGPPSTIHHHHHHHRRDDDDDHDDHDCGGSARDRPSKSCDTSSLASRGGKMVVTVVNVTTNRKTVYKVKRTQRLRSLMNHMSKSANAPLTNMQFQYNGQILTIEDSPERLGMTPNCVISVTIFDDNY